MPAFGNAPGIPKPFMNNPMQGGGVPPPWSSGAFLSPGVNPGGGIPQQIPPMPQEGMPPTYPGQGMGMGSPTMQDPRMSPRPMMSPMGFGGGQNGTLPGLAGAIQGMQPGQQRPPMNPDDAEKLRMLIQQYLSSIMGRG